MKIFVKDIAPGMELKSSFLVGYKKVKRAEGGEQCIMRLSDSSGSIFATVISNASGIAFSVGDVIECCGKAVEKNGKIWLEIDPVSIRIRKLNEINVLDYVPKCEKDTEGMLRKLQEYIETIRNPFLKMLLKNFFDDNNFVSRFVLAPAGATHHHNYAGGLLEHTLSVVQICDVAARVHPALDRDLLIAGAILHDVGKTKEYAWGPKLEVTAVGGLIGHSVLGIEMVSERLPSGFPEELKLKIHHMIVSHHGRDEWGAIVTPRFAEAEMLHHAENLDAKVKKFIREEEEGTECGSTWIFSTKLGRYIYLSGRRNKKEE